MLHDVIRDQMIPFAANALQWIVNGKKTSKTALSPWDFITVPEDRATAIGNMHRKIGKDRACGSGDMLADRQTDRRQTDRHVRQTDTQRHRQTERQTYRHTYILTTILRYRSHRRNKNKLN